MKPEAGQRLATEIREQQDAGVVRDQWLIPLIFKLLHEQDVHPVVSESFIHKSKDRYGAPWLARELVQNFLDANPHDKGTLNGVHLGQEDLPESEAMPKGGKRFTIIGNWVFDKPTGLISPHSEKPAGQQTAGGNGIGLKQTALRLIRDFGVKHFEVVGEGWEVAYDMANKDALNEEIHAATPETASPLAQVDHNWLVARLKKSKNRSNNAYVIETDHPEIIAALEQLSDIGVSAENKFLQESDFENEHGAIKWLPALGEDLPKGALFINGQIMNYGCEGKDGEEDYWQGPEGVTVRLNEVEYKMSIDRPPVKSHDLQSYLNTLVNSMKPAEMIEQLKRSEHLWTTQTDAGRYNSARVGCFVVIDKLVSSLRWGGDNPSQIFATHFADKPYLARDKVSAEDVKTLREKGFILCPDYFSEIGMPLASSKLERKAQLTAQESQPFDPEFDLRKLAQEKGIAVCGEVLPEFTTEQFLALMVERMREASPRIEPSPQSNKIFRVVFSGVKIPKELLFHQLPRPKQGDQAQQLLFFIRGAIQRGLDSGVFKAAHTSQDGFFSNYKTKLDYVADMSVLLVRHLEDPTATEFTFDFEVAEDADAAMFLRLLAADSNQILDKKLGTPEALVADSAPKTIPGNPDAGAVSTAEAVNVGVPVENEASVSATREASHDPFDEQAFRELTAAVALADTNNERLKKERLAIETELKAQKARRAARVKSPAPVVPKKSWAARFRSLAGPVAAVAATLGLAGVVVKDSWGQNQAEASDQAKPSGGKKTELSLADRMKKLTGITDLDAMLEKLRGFTHATHKKGDSATDRYLAWRNSKDFYGKLKSESGYMGATTLMDILAAQNQSQVEAASQRDSAEKTVARELAAIAGNLAGNDPVENFEIVTEPTENHLAQLAILRTYLEAATGMAISNDLFIFGGKGASGINLGHKAIGIHSAVLKTGFFEALAIMTHEVAHNNPDAVQHDAKFGQTEEALFTTINERLTTVARKAVDGETLSNSDRVLLDLQYQWDGLRLSGR